MKRFLILLSAIFFAKMAVADNIISLSSVSGSPQTEVEIVVSLENSDTISALEILVPLNDQMSYVENSYELSSARSNGHQISVAQIGNQLRIYIYSLSLNPLLGNSGELLKFRLLLKTEPYDYTLTPEVILSDTKGETITSATQSGVVTILAPKIKILTPAIDYGHIPIRASYTKNLQLENVGNLPLNVTNIVVNDTLIVPTQTAITVAPQATASVTLTYSPIERGTIARQATIYSDAINGEQQASIVADPFSVNELHVGSASGISDSIVSITLTMNNMEAIVAGQCAFKLPTQLEYVAGSLTMDSTRHDGHQTLSAMHGDTLMLMFFSPDNKPLKNHDGVFAYFQLRLVGTSGTYYLKPIDVVFSNITEENMTSATTQGSVRIQAPRINSNATLTFSDSPITTTAKASYTIRNNGGAPLVVERATFLAEGYRVVEDLPISLGSYKTTTLTVEYQPSEEGHFGTTMNLYTNDPTARLKTVALSGNIYAPNSLSMEGNSSVDNDYRLSIMLDNYSDIVAVQCDIHWIKEMRASNAEIVPSDRLSTHQYYLTELDEDSYRLIIYSMNNTPLLGHEGELLQISFTPEIEELDYCSSTIVVDNIVLSNANSQNKCSLLETTLTVNHIKYATENVTAENSYTWNENIYTLSGIYTDTIQMLNGCDSIITLNLTIDYPTKDIVATRNKISIYPNPSSDILYIEGKDIAILKVYDITGKLKYQLIENRDRLGIDIKNWDTGIYTIFYENKDKKATILKFIKQ